MCKKTSRSNRIKHNNPEPKAMTLDPTHDNDYDDEESVCTVEEEEESEVEEVKPQSLLVLEKPMTFVLAKPVIDGKIGKIKRPIVFKGTPNGWKSFSFVKGFNNEYVSNETWDCIEEQWLKCDAKNVEVFWDEEELATRVQEIKEKNKKFKEESEAYVTRGLELDEEIAVLKAQADSLV